MILPPKVIHPTGEPEFTLKKSVISALIADTFNGKIHIEWDSQAPVTTMGQLAFFIHYLKTGHRFMPWVEDCLLRYTSPNAPKKINVLGSFVLSILAGYTRYAYITRIQGDCVNVWLSGFCLIFVMKGIDLSTLLMALLITLVVVNLIGLSLIWYIKHHSHDH